MAEKRQGRKSVALEPYALEKAGDIRFICLIALWSVPLDDSKATLELAPKKAIVLHNKVETLPLQSN
ncbi:hypothetical protein F2Q69_00009988 [Brassica cretica]|uniref:Uncharacterized protein n=1 Tax=Brassica cretica TaxID=69181 RepID=A0A8S9PAR7_BRACR|nr:hypothetical protein F2Q69_00009988 [Brassica cretica]